ncbi:SIMPL domain-containing protein [Methanosarcina vacuolata]|mgnify:CR=1 FL=1|uniref:Outer membrane protein n=1 Tax=Methanosarcina vacuolata Z-761 TaxID=1434123 RepID=A0A0E3LI85_9EURY|nr:SIMPL domain-containing protein [Methanosarcina vacuolata]AKB45581.1 Outer membrane protein [Methanosarcina vacuolata Z-761]
MSQENKNDKLYYVIVALSVVLVLMSATIYAISQSGSEDNTENTISISGYAEQKVIPDTATMNIGVVIQSETAKEATDKNAALMNAVIAELKAMGLQDKEIQTSYVSVYPVYNYDANDTQTIKGYSASNSVQVTTKNLDNLSEIIDRSTAAGANNIGSVSFSVSDDKQKQLREDLMNKAVADASSKATTLAKSLGVEINGVQTSSVSETGVSGVDSKYDMQTETAAGAVSTPIQPGESTVSMSVQVTYYIE